MVKPAQLLQAAKFLNVREFRFGWWQCAVCGGRLHVRLKAHEMGVRCSTCGASPVTQSIVDVIKQHCPSLDAMDVYEMSSRGPLVQWLGSNARTMVTSEFIPGVSPGETLDGVRCEDAQELTFGDESFQLCTSTEVFEHVVDDKKGFSEVHRVLMAGGKFIFTVPMVDSGLTIERAYVENGAVVHMLEPEYHGDSYAKNQRVLCFRNYGLDIVSRIKESGFTDAVIARPASSMMGYSRWVIVATK